VFIGGIGGLGEVTGIDGDIVKVNWLRGKEGSYRVDQESSVRQVILADQDIGGQIFSKGMPALVDDDKLRERLQPWSLFGLEMLQVCSIRHTHVNRANIALTF
jgi:hypothetical protein